MEKTKFRCMACNYKFSRNNPPQVCPYCGKKSVVEDLESSAEDILNEIEEY
jgi:rubrerythrin